MRLLILGGTNFVGRHIAEGAIARGLDVTLFNRGITNASLFPEGTHLRGDRLGDASALEGIAFDAVIDTSCYHPRALELPITAGYYCFVSTISVYADHSPSGIDETAALCATPDPLPDPADSPGGSYGGLKAECERVVARRFGEQVLIVRPGLIVGPHEAADRFTYWVARAARGGEILLPAEPDRQVQLIDARDLAEWILGMTARAATGAFNATGPATPLTMRDVIDTCIDVAGTEATCTWVSGDRLAAEGVGEWVEMPMWLHDSGAAGIFSVANSRAVNAGMTFRPLRETARDTLEWHRTRAVASLKAGLAPQREAELLQKFHAR